MATINERLNQDMNRAFDLEESGHFEEALLLCNRCIQTFPEYKTEIEFEIAKMNCRNGQEEQALVQLLALYEETSIKDIADLVLEVFYSGMQEEYNRQYQENCRRLGEYAYFYGEKTVSEIHYYPIFVNETNIWYYDSNENNFNIIKRYKIVMEEPEDKIYLGSDLLWMEDIFLLEKMTRLQNPVMDMENPLLLVYRRETWELLLQILDLKELLAFDRIVFYDDKKRLEDSVLEDGVMIPERMFRGEESDKIMEVINDIQRKYEAECEKYKAAAVKFYNANGKDIIKHIKDGIPKILFITSRFTTVLQYHTKSCRAAAERMNLRTELIMGKDRLGGGNSILIHLKKIASFKPDIIFCIDHFRFEHASYMEGLDSIVWVCWVQDPMPCIMDKSSPSKLGSRDIILNHYITWKRFFDVGYDEKRLIYAPIPADAYVYKSYKLTPKEEECYSCDICLVCHASGVEQWIKGRVGDTQEGAEILYEIYNGYRRLVYETGKCFYAEEEFRQYVKGVLKQYEISIADEVINTIAEDMFLWLNQRIYRELLVDWLLDAGFVNIKLWGNGWKTNPKYAAYAMGPAENGETLSRIYQASKIVLGNNIGCTAAARAWESMLSGAFYMSNYVPPEEDSVDIRKIIKENDELVMFRDKEDLLQKVKYYLTHEEERRRMAEIGHKAALEKMTFDELMNRMLREIPGRIEQLENSNYL